MGRHRRARSATWSDSWLAYWAGAVGGRPLVDRFGRYLLIRPHEVDKAHDWFERYGDAAVFFSRLLPVIRTFISLPAGVVRMPFWRFTLYTVLGCLPWTFALAWLGYELGDRWERSSTPCSRSRGRSPACASIAAAWYVRRRWTTVRAEYAALDAGEGAPARAEGYAQRLTSIVQLSPCSPTFSKPTRWYIMRERLCTATESESVWKPSSRACTIAARSSVPPMPLRRCSGCTATESSGVFSSTKP